MNRRELAKTLGLGTIASGLRKTALALSDREPQIAITSDDINLFSAPPEVARRRNRALLDALGTHPALKAAAFPAGKNIDSEFGRSLVREWGDQRFEAQDKP
jgi:hypothetical protein